MDLMAKLSLYFSYPFVRYAMVVGVLISLCSSLLGVTLVLKRFSFIGDGLSHVAFGAMAVAAIVGLTNDMLLVLPITIICAVLLLRSGQNALLKGDAALAIQHELVDELRNDGAAVDRVGQHFTLRDKSTSGHLCPS